MNKLALQSQVIINTRPKDQAQSLTKLLKQHGATVIECPTIKLNWPTLTQETPPWPRELSSYQHIIFVSANAVPAVKMHWRPTRACVICVGPATEAAVGSFESNIIKPQLYSSEGILNLPQLQNLSKQNVLILCGSDHKSLLADSLKERGAIVDTVITYEIEAHAPPDNTTLGAVFSQHIDKIIITSSLSLKVLHSWFNPQNQFKLIRTPLIMGSENSANLARSLGWTNDCILLADNPTNQSILETLVKKA